MTVPLRRGRGRGGQGGHEPRLRIRQREERVQALSIQGRHQTEIAAELGISQAAVSKILRRLNDRAVGNLAGEMRRQIVQSMRRYDHFVVEALRAWERSKGGTTQRRQRKTS